MQRAFFSAVLGVIAIGLAIGSRLTIAAAEPEPHAQQSPRTITLEIVIGKTQDSITPEQAAQLSGPSEKVAAFVGELESSGRISVIDRIRLTTLENQKALVQAGKNAPVATGQTFESRSGPRQTSYLRENVGTLISVVARADGDAVMAELEIEKSQLEQRAGDSAPGDPFVPPAKEIMQSRANVRIGNGTTLLVSTDAARQFVLVSTRLLDGAPGPETGASTAPAMVDKIKLFQLQNSSAQAAAELVKALFGRDAGRIAVGVDARTNALIVRAADERQLEAIEAILMRLDESDPQDAPPRDAATSADERRVSANSPVWQYRAEKVEINLNLGAQLDKLGAEGWELVEIVDGGIAVFKRQKRESGDPRHTGVKEGPPSQPASAESDSSRKTITIIEAPEASKRAIQQRGDAVERGMKASELELRERMKRHIKPREDEKHE